MVVTEMLSLSSMFNVNHFPHRRHSDSNFVVDSNFQRHSVADSAGWLQQRTLVSPKDSFELDLEKLRISINHPSTPPTFSHFHRVALSKVASSPTPLLHLSNTAKMGVWDAFTGRKSQPSDAPTSASQTIQDPAAGVSFNNVTSEDVGSFMTAPGAFDASALHPLAGLGQDTLDYLNLDDSALSDLPNSNSFLPSRGWSDDLCYGAGVAYLGALSMGGVWGLAEGLNRLPASAPPKLRLNSVLNAVTRRGPFLGNSAGVVAMMYNGFNSTIGYYRGKHDALNSVAAGGISGMIFKSSRGLRPAMVSGGIVAGLAGTWAVSFETIYFSQH